MTSQTKSPSVADILVRALQTKNIGCSVEGWVQQQGDEIKNLMDALSENRRHINVTKLHGELRRAFDIPFGLTSFKSHLSGSCVCQEK